jgi:serine/threonine protein kinase
MGDQRWRDISRLYDQAAALAPGDRAPFLRKACGGDEALRAEIESLLRDDTRVNELLESKGSHTALIGQRIGGYEIRSLLGVGGMGEVYRARDPKLDRDVAIKVLPVGFASDGERLARFQREARLLASLNHRSDRDDFKHVRQASEIVRIARVER